MSLTLKQLCDSAREEIGFSKPAAYASTTDEDGLQTFRLANREGLDLAKSFTSALKTNGTITLVAAQQSYALASDFRFLIPSTIWDQTNQRYALGPLTPEEWAANKNWGYVFGLNWRYEIRGGNLVFEQTVAAGDAGTVISYEYISKNWCESSLSVGQVRFAADTDTQKFDDDLFIQGIAWRLKKAKGFPWQEDFAFYKAERDNLLANDGGLRDIYMKQGPDFIANVPEGNYG